MTDTTFPPYKSTTLVKHQSTIDYHAMVIPRRMILTFQYANGIVYAHFEYLLIKLFSISIHLLNRSSEGREEGLLRLNNHWPDVECSNSNRRRRD